MSRKHTADPVMVAQSCTGKEQMTHERALKVARDMRRRDRPGSKAPPSAYKCPCCGHWHVGGGSHLGRLKASGS